MLRLCILLLQGLAHIISTAVLQQTVDNWVAAHSVCQSQGILGGRVLESSPSTQTNV